MTRPTARICDQQPRRGAEPADVVDRADQGEQHGGEREREPSARRQAGAQANAPSQAPINVAATTAMPPPCGVGIACEERAFGRAIA